MMEELFEYQEEPSDISYYQNIDKAMENGYQIITGRRTFEDILIESENFYLVFNIDDYDENKVIEELIQYYQEVENYERCEELVSFRNRSKKK